MRPLPGRTRAPSSRPPPPARPSPSPCSPVPHRPRPTSTSTPRRARPAAPSVLTFQVPGESETGALTTQLSVALPNVASARAEVMPGWTARLDRDAAAGTVRSVTWTAAPSVGISSDQFALFRDLGDAARPTVGHPSRHPDVLGRHRRALGSAAAARRRRARTPGAGAEPDRAGRHPAGAHEPDRPRTDGNGDAGRARPRPGSGGRRTTRPVGWRAARWSSPRWAWSLAVVGTPAHVIRRFVVAASGRRRSRGAGAAGAGTASAHAIRSRDRSRAGQRRVGAGSAAGQRHVQREAADELRRHDRRRARRQPVVDRLRPRSRAPIASVALLPLGPTGTYTVNYRVTSADGHVVSGAWSFELTGPGTGTPGPPVGAGGSTTAACRCGRSWRGRGDRRCRRVVAVRRRG